MYGNDIAKTSDVTLPCQFNTKRFNSVSTYRSGTYLLAPGPATKDRALIY